ncbi:MAG: hypothetical protein AAB605_02095 [Patescibacteria group bacterium]
MQYPTELFNPGAAWSEYGSILAIVAASGDLKWDKMRFALELRRLVDELKRKHDSNAVVELLAVVIVLLECMMHERPKDPTKASH